MTVIGLGAWCDLVTEDEYRERLVRDGWPADEVENLVRDFKRCKESMRSDASVCPTCRRESEPWSFRGGYWWTVNGTGEAVWLEEATGSWRPGPPRRTAGFDVVLQSMGASSPDTLLKVMRGFVTVPDQTTTKLLESQPPLTLFSGLGGSTANGLADELRRKGAVVEVHPHEVIDWPEE